jgi:hypothetical protein
MLRRSYVPLSLLVYLVLLVTGGLQNQNHENDSSA